MDIRSFAMQLINSNPNIRNNPGAQEMIRAIESGNSARGQELANNLLASMNVDRETAVQQARQFFGI